MFSRKLLIVLKSHSILFKTIQEQSKRVEDKKISIHIFRISNKIYG